MRSVKNGELFEDIPARSFHRLAQHAIEPVKRGRRVRPTGAPWRGSFETQILPGRAGQVHRMGMDRTGPLDWHWPGMAMRLHNRQKHDIAIQR